MFFARLHDARVRLHPGPLTLIKTLLFNHLGQSLSNNLPWPSSPSTWVLQHCRGKSFHQSDEKQCEGLASNPWGWGKVGSHAQHDEGTHGNPPINELVVDVPLKNTRNTRRKARETLPLSYFVYTGTCFRLDNCIHATKPSAGFDFIYSEVHSIWPQNQRSQKRGPHLYLQPSMLQQHSTATDP